MTRRKQAGETKTGFVGPEKVLRLLGIWPLNADDILRSSLGRWCFAMLTQVTAICSLTTEVYRHCLDVDDTMDAFVMDLSSMISLSKMFILRFNWKHTYALVNSMEEDWSSVEDSDHRNIMTKYQEKGRVVSMLLLYMGYASGVSIIVKSLPLHELPFQMFQIPPNSTNALARTLKTKYFLSTYCAFGIQPWSLRSWMLAFQAVTVFINVVGHCGNDGYFFSLTMHLCGQFEVLRVKLAEIEIEKSGYGKKVGLLVQRHCRLMILAGDLEQSFNVVILVQLLMSLLLLCVEGFMMLVCLNANDRVGVLKCVMFVTTLLLQLYVYTYAGDALESQTAEISFGAYDSTWYRSRGHRARDLALIIIRGNSPYCVTAGKFVSMNLLTFKEILKASASYMSVLKVMMDACVDYRRTIHRLFVRATVMTKSTNKDFSYAMWPMKILSWPVGTWPLQKYDIVSGMRCFVSIILLLLVLTIVHTEIYLDSSDAEKNLDSVVLITCGFLAVWKVLCFRVHSKGLVDNFMSAMKDYDELNDLEKKEIVRRHAQMGRIACGSVIFFSYFGSTLFTTAPMLAGEGNKAAENVNITQEDSLNYPMPSQYTLEMLDLPASLYPVIYIGEYILLLTISTGNLGSDSLFYGIIFHLCGQAEVLKLDFSKFVEFGDKKVRFNALVARHQQLLKLCQDLSDTISSVMILQLFSSCLLICTTGFEFVLSLSANNIVMVIKTLIVVSTLLVQLFAYSYIGEYMKNQFEGVGYWVYCSDWYNIPRKLSFDIVFILMRAQTPIYLKAGHFFVINMETYMSIVKTSMSYLSVLRVMVA
ncbi:odorant receptor 63 [Augochlora pura]